MCLWNTMHTPVLSQSSSERLKVKVERGQHCCCLKVPDWRNTCTYYKHSNLNRPKVTSKVKDNWQDLKEYCPGNLIPGHKNFSCFNF